MRRALLFALAALLLVPAAASAHPLGNFSVNHLTKVRATPERLDVRYVLDQAEIPTFQERGLAPQQVIARKRAEVLRNLAISIGGRRVALTPGVAKLSHPPGQGGLPTTRVELALSARLRTFGAVRVHDGTFPGRIGWKAVVPLPGAGTAVRSDVPAMDPTGELRHYPRDLLKSPADVRDARLTVSSGHGTVSAPGAKPLRVATSSSDGFAGLLERDGTVLALLLVAAFGWGALHALSPGHGKSMVAAYLVGTRGSVKDAVALGLTVTVTHTAGVVALGFVALALSQFILPETLYPYLNLVAGLLVVGVGVQVLRRRVRPHTHHHHVQHRRSILALGASAGLIPCPSALVVLLGAISQHRIALGLVLIVAFSAGLATTLTGLGVAVVQARRALTRFKIPARGLSTASAAMIVVVGTVLTLHAVPQL